MKVTRREVLVGGAALACVGADAPPAGVVGLPAPEGTTYVLAPPGPGPFPLLVALHGRGEARKGPERGGLGWFVDYDLPRIVARFAAPPLTADDLGGLSDPARLAALNARLAARPYRGVVVACPYVPDLDMYDDAAVDAYGAHLVDTVLPKVCALAPVSGLPTIDGVSLGGRVALRVGLTRPTVFGAVGGIQPAMRTTEAAAWAALAKTARKTRPDLRLRLLTSDGDPFRPAVEAAGAALTAAGVEAEVATVPGPHDYAFNRGPGSVELLAFASG